MNLLKIVGGAAAGVGAMALAPVFGPVLTVTAAGAALGGLLGAGAAAAAGRTLPPDPMPGPDPDAAARERAALAVRLAALQERLRSHRSREAHILALFAVATAAAWRDHSPEPDGWAELKQALLGLTWDDCSDGLRAQLQGLYDAPPTLQQALAYVDPHDTELHDRVDDAIALAILLDDRETPAEAAFCEAWRRWRAEQAA